MPTVTPTGAVLGARITGIDLAASLSCDDFALILRTLATYGVVCFPGQSLEPAAQAAFSRRFGTLEVHVSGAFQVPEHPEVMILSNMVENGRPIGLADAGQDWHTDMSFSRTIAFVNVLHAIKVPRRNGRVLGDTQFADMAAAFDDLPPALQARLETLTATHDFAKFWDMMLARGGADSVRKPLTAAQRAQKPPVSQPMALRHPLSGRRILYANPGYTVRIDGMAAAESDALLETLFAHQLQPRYQYAHHWAEGDVLMWDNIRTMHYAVPDYGPGEHRLVRRCQAMADRVFEPEFAGLAGV
ncbi:MAG TPA: TauD/TfdA family dioxygenase [Acetobacteraceae bacterium]|jgi:taurine dioxygenase|nr:TauD/TfdA family dioxygenase [Acetobacteraceae bacterium]